MQALDYPHFPTKIHALIWRNWGVVPVSNIAKAINTTEENIIRQAENMGLRVPPCVSPRWLAQSYNTIIRANWHLLPYDQLIVLLGWTRNKLMTILKEEDFLWLKLGLMKPETPPLSYREFEKFEIESAKKIKNVINKYFSNIPHKESYAPFGFSYSLEHQEKIPQNLESKRNGLRMVYPYAMTYGDPLSDLDLSTCWDELLYQQAQQGINAIWLQGVIYNLFPGRFCHELCAGYSKRMENLNKLISKAASFNIGVYLYLNEPRGPSPDFYRKHPELNKDFLGIEYPERNATGMCTSKPAVREYLYEGISWVFQNAPGLAGAFTITMSENPTNCYSKGMQKKCPVCSTRSPEDVLSEINNIIEKAIHEVSPNADVIAWTWGGWKTEWAAKAIDLLNKNIQIMCTSEEEMPIEVAGIKNKIGDYSISQTGPGAKSLHLWQYARKRGFKVIAKVQLNNSWECAAVPYIPATRLVEKHLRGLRQLNIDNFMVSWTLGGYPGMNLDLLWKSHEEMVVDRFGREASSEVEAALDIFSDAFSEFPFSHEVVYRAPHNIGPANLFYEYPTGYQSTMVGFPYDDLENYRANYPEDIFQNQFGVLSEKWKKGMAVLLAAKTKIKDNYKENFNDLTRVASAAYCHFKSTFLQVSFIRLRDSEQPNTQAKIKQILTEEIINTLELYKIVLEDSRIGFEATNQYMYTLNDLQEKVINCEYLIESIC